MEAASIQHAFNRQPAAVLVLDNANRIGHTIEANELQSLWLVNHQRGRSADIRHPLHLNRVN